MALPQLARGVCHLVAALGGVGLLRVRVNFVQLTVENVVSGQIDRGRLAQIRNQRAPRNVRKYLNGD